MYVSLTYPFNIVQHTLSHIVEHRKFDSLATPDNIVWFSSFISHILKKYIQINQLLQSKLGSKYKIQ